MQKKCYWLPFALWEHRGGRTKLRTKILMVMRLTILLLTTVLLHVHASSSAQYVTLSGKELSLKAIFSSVEKQTGFVTMYDEETLNGQKPLTISVNAMPLAEFLDLVVKDQPVSYFIQGKTIFFTRREPSSPPGITTTQPVTVMLTLPLPFYGVVTDSAGSPLSGASIRVKGKRVTTVSDATGAFSIAAEKGDVLVISFLGYRKREVTLGDRQTIHITLQIEEADIREVVINTGIIKRDKASFTGAATVYTGAQLKAVGNRNVLESLRSLDPSFIKVENNLKGSNPNSMPTFEIRGQTTINTNTLNDQFSQDPNQPLFILDGFESTLQSIYDLDMNRVASITILKDAASTALYGSKAANGVVVVETKRPVPGKLRMSYNSDLTFEMPDLSSYNLMNAAEKLEFELQHGFIYQQSGNAQWNNILKYNSRLAEVQRGVNTDWLSEPVRTGLSHRHSLQFTGGNNDLMFNSAVSYGKQLGVMKGSDRETWGGNVGLSYRKGNLNLNNMLSLSGSKAVESPYGDFATFAQAIPYYRMRSPDGSIPKFLDTDYEFGLENPLYNASLSSLNETTGFSFFNNLDAIYTFSSKFRIQAGLQLSKGINKGVRFIPPENTVFDNSALTQQGSYTEQNASQYAYNVNLMLNYGEMIGKSQLSATIRGNLSETNNSSTAFTAVGFPYGTDGNPVYAFGFAPFSTPNALTARKRSAGLLASFNYAWDQRFMFDAVYRLDGTSVFGTDHIFQPFVSGGVGWNIHQEPFLRGSKNINLLKIRANAGYTGNENLGQFSSVSTFSFQTGNNNAFGQGITLGSLGNPSLNWQRTLQMSYGLDFSLWNSRISGYLEYFVKKTDPLTIGTEGTLPSSTGTGSGYVMNIGNLTTKGWSFSLRVLPVNNTAERIIWSVGVMGSNYKSTYGGLADRLAKLNEEQTANKGMLRFMDGYSPDDLWAVVSHGVDPATGYELFQKKDGSLSFYYTTDDIVKVGNARPTLEGGINTSFTYRDFTFGTVIRYRVGGYVFNTALYDKVENVGYIRENLDKRALYDRWKQPGDISQFTGITNTTANLTSRFIQKDNHMIGESFNLSWHSYANWVKALRLQSLFVNFYMNDIFRFEKIRSERGIEYPYARTASLSINVGF